MDNDARTTAWKTAYWILLVAWIIGAATNMWRVRGGLFTDYFADLTFPPWYYIVIRGTTTYGRQTPRLLKWFSHSSERAAISIFLAGVLYELGQRYGFIPGTFDLWDIVVYAFGLAVCYIIEKKQLQSAVRAEVLK